MFDQAMLREQFLSLLAMERNIAAGYADLAAQSVDPQLRSQFEQLCRDKQRHVKLAERLIEIVQ